METPPVRFRRGAKAALFTLGPDPGDYLGTNCEVNAHLSARVRGFLERNGYRLTRQPSEADVVLFNACVLTDRIVEFNEAFILKAMAKYPDKGIVLFGCFAGFAGRFAGDPRVLVVPPEESERLADLFEHETPLSEVRPRRVSDNDYIGYQPGMDCSNNFVLIGQGCANACSYCNIKLAKGPLLSRPFEALRGEVLQALSAGETEVTLLADDCASYGLDLGTDLAGLVERLLALDPRLKLHLYRMHPAPFLRFLPRLLPSVATGRLPYAGIMMQSASPRILKLMNRDYSPDEVRRALRALKAAHPGLFTSTHFMFNFPTETLADFQATLDFAKEFDYSVLLLYGENRRTPAAKLGGRCSREDFTAKLELARRHLAAHPEVKMLIHSEKMNW